MSDHVGYRRTEDGLKTAIVKLQELSGRAADLTAETPHELMKMVEVQNLIDCGEMVARAALFRTESRCAPFHYRLDYPNKDDDKWLAFVIARKDGEGMNLSKRPVQ